MKERYIKKKKKNFGLLRKSVAVHIFMCVHVCKKIKNNNNNVCFLPKHLLAITLDGSDSLTGECTLTKVQPHSSQPSQRAPKTARWEKKRNNDPVFHGCVACVHLAKVMNKRVINIAGIIVNNEMQ